MRSLRTAVSLILVLQTFLVQANVLGATNATCLPGFDWVLNDLGQIPCLVVAYLSSQCSNTSKSFPYLPPGTLGPASACRCNTVAYNLISACAACQGAIIGPWDVWVQYCVSSMITVGKYPSAVPQGTEIPVFAFYDPTITGLFDVEDAQRYIADHTHGGNGDRMGKIIGGTVGGTVGLLLAVFGLVFAFNKRFRGKIMAILDGNTLKHRRKDSADLDTPLMKRNSFQSDIHPGQVNRVTMSFERIPQDEHH
ncbi:hypothetical protein BOTBODRAFT_60438 [Botryobasidium botryosum FD-172 SS1]|uniref:Transmembrane protein n=1 Tax=Botryobasidium botryosum (strain FD-172 SS1) TaxID=930990 RepID=A0A067M4I8_BOTB1|nr:hypothetical protein BOTBODRAFT_60438 [Botryobasidium botryosum FD-172 SS1]